MTRTDLLVRAAAEAVMLSIAGDDWQSARASIVTWWSGIRPDQAGQVRDDLGLMHAELTAADAALRRDLAIEWEMRLARLVRAEPGHAGTLRPLLDEELGPRLPPSDRSRVHVIEMTGDVSGHGEIIIAGRDVEARRIRRIRRFDSADLFQLVLSGRGPGRLLIVIGLALVAVGMIRLAASFTGPCAPGTTPLPSDLPTASVALAVVFVGGLVVTAGSELAASKRGRLAAHWLITAVVVAGLAVAFLILTNGAAPDALFGRASCG
ncbi:hypothetical protein [Actinomadura decatromicini]|uniref:Uncharacterized protein n=1 Tax=Actinomadura decatromicini TaxID=2604572 RepID=A0A5D3FWM5_9ACTN|nr:hypothetical protein [Actinomadura decatromicini]TYK52438.1 hypothetical protein FXF68_01245 [Actinomadura decatromicini]